MSIFDRRKTQQLQEMARTVSVVEKEKTELQEQVRLKDRRVQELLVDNILALRVQQQKYVGNDYRDYTIAVQAISDKYNGKAEWGVLQVGTIVDLRAAFILGEGISVNYATDTKAEAEAELQWAKDFIEYNALDSEMAQELAKESEIEGKVALRLFWDDLSDAPWRGHTGMVSVRYLSWCSKHYKVIVDPQDYLSYQRLTWNATSTAPAGDVPEEEFVYRKFGGRIYDANDAQPKIMKCLTQIDRLDHALRDLREINHMFASQTPDFECETPQQAAQLLQFIADKNWKIGKAIAHVGKFSLVGPDTSGVANLLLEIEMNVKMISGTTGIPIHYLGLLDLLRNRATGDNTRELVMAATTRERSIWVGVYDELLDKAMTLYNLKSGEGQKTTALDPEAIDVDIPLISQDHWSNIEKVLIPAALGDIISKEYVASVIPGIDLDEEMARREEREASELEAAKTELESIRLQGVGVNSDKKVKPSQQEE